MSPYIVTRLRIVFAFIAVVLCLGVMVGFDQIQKLNRSVHALTDTTVAVFVVSEDIERSQRQLLQFFLRLDGISDTQALKSLQDELTVNMAVLRSRMQDLAATQVSPSVVRDLSSALDEIEASTSEIMRLKFSNFATKAQLVRLEQALEESRQDAQLKLEHMAYTTSAFTAFDGQDFAGYAPNQLAQTISQNFIDANAVTSITLELEAIVERARALRNITEAEALTRSADALRFKMRGLAVLLSQVTRSQDRTDLAADIVRIRKLIIDEGSIVAQVAQLQASFQDLDRAIVAQNTPIKTISTLSQNLVQNAQTQIDVARGNLKKTSQNIVVALIGAAALSLVVIAGAVLFVVETQINHRVGHLADAVQAIAAGDTDYPIKVRGNDELGHMALALQVFKENAEELKRSNHELERFAYIAAHDLRSPLRAIKDLTEWTLEDPYTKFSEDGLLNMAILRSRIDRLNQLLKDLLEYSQAGNEKGSVAEISIAEIIAETTELLDSDQSFAICYTGIQDDFITYETPVRQILLNLLSNAIKHHDQNTGLITVDVIHENDRLKFTVQDDGPGIAPSYHDRIFGLFQTLRSRDEVEGSGIGLAIIRKLVERYGGTIHVESDPSVERGSKFIFDLPELSKQNEIPKHAA